MNRCGWAQSDQLYMDYHDLEWGVPIHDDRILFEFLLLEGAQAGLSWSTILRKRENYRLAFDQFEPEKIASYDDTKIKELLGNSGIVRNRLKIKAAVGNAQHFIEIQEAFGSFDAYLWKWTDGKPIQNAWKILAEIPAHTPLSDQISKDLTLRGFRFVGSTICYAFIQAIGIVNDHTVDCFRYRELNP